MFSKKVGARLAVGALLMAVAAGFATRGAVAQGEVIIENNVEYSNPDNQHMMLNIARPQGNGPFPAILCIHGGGFRAGDRSGYNGLIKRLAERGYVAATVEYRLAPKYQFPA